MTELCQPIIYDHVIMLEHRRDPEIFCQKKKENENASCLRVVRAPPPPQQNNNTTPHFSSHQRFFETRVAALCVICDDDEDFVPLPFLSLLLCHKTSILTKSNQHNRTQQPQSITNQEKT
jgi:hypothetical protein